MTTGVIMETHALRLSNALSALQAGGFCVALQLRDYL